MNTDENVNEPRDREPESAAPDAGEATTTRTDAPPSAPPRQLLRYPDDGPGAGVAAGLGSYFGIDPVLFRIAFVVLAFAGGSGILLYLIGWIVIPEAPAGHVPAAQAAPADDRTLQWVGAGLIVVAALWLTAQFDIVRPPVLWAIALIVLGVLLFRGDLTRRPSRPPAEQHAGTAVPPAPTPPPAPAWRAAPPGPPPPPAPPRPPSMLGRLAVGVALIAVGGAALLDNAGVLDLTLRHYVALVLVVVGLALVAGAWWGRGRGLIWVGALLVPVLLFAAVADAFWNVRGGVGERFYAPVEAEEVRARYELFAGQMHIDLSDVDFSGRSQDVGASVTFGELVVIVPPDVDVDVDARVGGGEVSVPAEAAPADGFGRGQIASGLRVTRRAMLEGEPGGGELALNLSAGFGTVSVHRSP